MHKKGYIQFGNLDSPGGSMIIFEGPEGIAKCQADLVKFKLQKQGIFITPEIEFALFAFEVELLAKITIDITVKGIQPTLKSLLQAKRKKDAESICKKMVLKQSDLAHLIFNYRQLNFSIESKHPKFYPDHLKTSPEEERALWNGEVKNFSPLARGFFRKKTRLFNERRCVSAHMFSKHDEWHCFYFSYEDAFSLKRSGSNHWKFGDHLHYTSYLWGLDKDRVWSELDKRQSKINGEHIRFYAD